MSKIDSAKNKKSKNVLVTGAGGFLGKAVSSLLIERGDRVTGFSRGEHPELSAMGVRHIRGDISDPTAVDKACKDMNRVFHIAAKPGVWGDYSDYYKTNFIGTKNVVDACIKNKVPCLVHTSSPSVVFNGLDMEGVDESTPYPEKFHAHYPKTKALAEQVVAEGKPLVRVQDNDLDAFREATGPVESSSALLLRHFPQRPGALRSPGA